MRRLAGIAAIIACVVLPVASAPARSHSSEFCAITGTVALTPGLTTGTQSFGLTGGGHETFCQGSDHSIRSAVLTISGSGRGGCLGSSMTGHFTTAWNNGAVSSGTFTAHTLTLVQGLSGRVTDGRFTGGVTGELHLLTKANVFACASEPGLTDVAFGGFLRYNGP